ncbi:MAG: sugar porter family MFS transporter [Endomicrobium sp.]|nr:sugar porter family MFS transporter [Endomicrobium sp.]
MKNIGKNFVFFFGALGGLLFGYDTGVISGAIIHIKEDMVLTSFEQGVVVSAILLGAIIGAATIGPLSDKFGRRKLVLTAAIIFCLCSLLSAFATGAVFLIISRIVLGTAVGGASALVPVYLAEMAPAQSRGRLSSLNQLMVMSGILLAYIVDYAFDKTPGGWRIMLGFATLPSVLLFVGTLFLPESPRWLISNGKETIARHILNSLRAGDNEVENEIKDIKETTAELGGFKELRQKWVRPALVTGIGLAIFQQIIGCNTVLYYAPTIFTNIGLGSSAAILGTVGIGILNVIVTFIALLVMDKFDRKKMLIAGSIGMALSLFALGILPKFAAINSSAIAYITMISSAIYIMFFCATWGPIMWIMIGEIFPLKIRGLGVGISSVSNWTANLIVALTFPLLLEKFGTKLFMLFGFMAVLSILFVKYKVFETRGRSLEEIEITLKKSGA